MDNQPEQKTTATNSDGEFGKSEAGARLDYENAKCNDIFFAILFILHLLAIVILCIVMNAVVVAGHKSVLEQMGFGNTAVTLNIPPIVYAALGVTIVVCSLWGVAWLKICEKWPETIIKVSLFMLVAYGALIAILGIAMGIMYYTVVGIIYALFALLYTWCVWDRIPFSSVLLGISSAITTTFEGTIWIGVATIPMNICWYICWLFAMVGIIEAPQYKMLADRYCSMSIYSTKDYCKGYGGTVVTTGTGLNGGTFFLMLISLYWGFNVVKNIAHTTTCGVVGAWYFSSGVVRNLTSKALKRSLTTSFGSIALGSLIVAILQALRAILRSQRRSVLGCIVYCFLLCIEWLIKKFNKYAFCYCAIYGQTFLEAAGSVWGLLFSKGIMLIVNDSIVGVVIAAGGFLGFVFALGVSLAMLIKEVNAASNSNDFLSLFLFIIFIILIACIGYAFTAQILQVLNSAIACLFVCFAEEPNALKANRPEQYNALASAGHPRVNRYIQFGHAGEENDDAQTGGGQQQQQQQQQQPR